MRPRFAEVFEGFYWHTLNSGVLPFNMRLLSPLGVQWCENVEFLELYDGPTPLPESRGGEGRIWEFSVELLIPKPPDRDCRGHAVPRRNPVQRSV